MGVIKLHTVNERLVFDDKPVITSGNKNINSIEIKFCDKWLSLGERVKYWAVFYKDEKEKLKKELVNGSCLIPNEMLIKKGFFYFGVYAEEENEEKVKTSKIVEYEVALGISTEATAESNIVKKAKEEYRAQLENTLEAATGENLDGKTWEELNYIVQNGFSGNMSEIDIDDIFEKTENSINLYEPTTEGWIDNTSIYSDGSTKENSKFCLTSKIPVQPNTIYSVSGWDKGSFYCYDSNDNYIGSSMTQLEGGDIDFGYGTTKENTAYIRLNISKETDLETTIENFNSSFMLVEGIGIATSKYGFKSTIREIGDLNALDFEDEADKKNLVVAINALKRFSTLTDETKTEIAEQAVELIDTALLPIIGSGVIE